jgi:hypothetical protein
MSIDCSRAFGGWLAGCGAATAVLSGFALILLTITSGGDITRLLLGIVALPFPSFLVFVGICLLTAIPALIVIWLSEELRIRSVLFFSCAGGAIGVLIAALLFQSFISFIAGCLFGLSGCVAGLNYWYVAGRYAGQDNPRA